MAVRSNGADITVKNTPTQIDQVGSTGGQYNVRVVNRNAQSVTVKLGLSDSAGGFTSERILEEALLLGADSAWADGPITMELNDYLIAQADSVNVNVLLMGLDAIQ